MLKFDYIKDVLIKESLEQYKELIDNKKPDKLSVSNYKVLKPWGHEIWLEINEYYTFKLIHMKAGYKSSLQYHEKKIETNYVISGKAEVLLEDENGAMQSKIYNVGEGWSVPVKTKHRVISLQDYTALECSTTHLNDVIRFSDDTNRNSGKVESEHEV